MVKKKFKITFDVDCQYPNIEAFDNQLSTDFNMWITEWFKDKKIIPTLYQKFDDKSMVYNAIIHQPNGCVRVRVELDNKLLLKTWWDELSDDF